MCNYLIAYSNQFCLINSADKFVTLSLPLINPFIIDLRYDDDTRGSGR